MLAGMLNHVNITTHRLAMRYRRYRAAMLDSRVCRHQQTDNGISSNAESRIRHLTGKRFGKKFEKKNQNLVEKGAKLVGRIVLSEREPTVTKEAESGSRSAKRDYWG